MPRVNRELLESRESLVKQDPPALRVNQVLMVRPVLFSSDGVGVIVPKRTVQSCCIPEELQPRVAGFSEVVPSTCARSEERR